MIVFPWGKRCLRELGRGQIARNFNTHGYSHTLFLRLSSKWNTALSNQSYSNPESGLFAGRTLRSRATFFSKSVAQVSCLIRIKRGSSPKQRSNIHGSLSSMCSYKVDLSVYIDVHRGSLKAFAWLVLRGCDMQTPKAGPYGMSPNLKTDVKWKSTSYSHVEFFMHTINLKGYSHWRNHFKCS